MSDELAPEEVQDEALDATLEAEDTESTEASDEQVVDWQKRYSDLQPEFSRASARVKELERLEPLADWQPVLDDLNNPNDPTARQRALNWLQTQFGGDLDEETGDEGMDEFRDPRVDTLLAKEQQRDAEQALGELNGHVDQLLKEADVSVTDRQRRALVNQCIEEGFSPDTTQEVVKGWIDDIGNWRNETIKAYRDGKLKQPAPPVRSGASGTEHVPLNTERDRRKAALEIANQEFQ